jgi:RNA polymerase sigma factor (TIGR02999 family)
MSPGDATQLLLAWQRGDRAALAALTPLVYDELHRRAGALMRGERLDHTLQPTALVSEAFLKLVNQHQVPWQDRVHFFAVAARQMRRILVDHARARAAEKRGGLMVKVSLEEEGEVACRDRDIDLIDLSDALEALEQLDPELGRLVELRYFTGLSIEQTAAALGVSTGTVKRRWQFTSAWLKSRLEGATGGSSSAD